MIDPSILEILLMEYAAGHLRPSEALVVTCHLALSPNARKRVQAYEALGAKMICDDCGENDIAAVSDDCFDKIMSRIEQPAPIMMQVPRTPMQQDRSIPPAVMSLLCGHCTERSIRWQAIGPGVEAVSLHVPAGSPCRHRLRLMRLGPHQQIPMHRHGGREMTLVLEGSFSDHTGTYRKGDLVVIDDPAFAHQPRAGDQGCLCLILTDAPIYFKKVHVWILRIFRRR